MKKLLVFTSLLSICMGSSAQADSLRELSEITVSATKRSQQILGTRVDQIDSLALRQLSGQSLAELLSQQSGVFIKNYGPGNLASTSLRGGSASQTQLYWGNLNIQNPMLGQNDFSLFPAWFFNNIQIAYGGIGGIYLDNSNRFNQGFTANLQLQSGSFGMRQIAAGISNSGQKSFSSIKFFHRTIDNDFTFLNTYLENPERQKLSHSHSEQNGLLAEHVQQFSVFKLALKGWFTQSDRDLPPSMAQSESQATQHDDSQRLMAELSRIGNTYQLIASAGFFRDRINYRDEGIDSDSRNWSAIQQVEFRKSFNSPRFQSKARITNTYTTAETRNYGPVNPHQDRILLLLTGEYHNLTNTFNAQLGVRQELVKGISSPLCPIIGAEWAFTKYSTVLFNVSRIYRIPTFNDQFWIPGGNPNLLPEQGFGEEIGLRLSKKFARLEATETTTFFNKNITNWIIWLPSDKGYFSPTNLMEVWSRGLETKWKVDLPVNQVLLSVTILSNYTVCTYQKARLTGDDAVGRQLIYTPLYTGQGTATVLYKDFALSYNHTYTGYTYTSSDNLTYLAPYQLGNLYFNKKLGFRKYAVDFGFRCLNIWNKDYQTVAVRPMPGRNFQFSINFSFHQS